MAHLLTTHYVKSAQIGFIKKSHSAFSKYFYLHCILLKQLDFICRNDSCLKVACLKKDWRNRQLRPDNRAIKALTLKGRYMFAHYLVEKVFEACLLSN